MKYLSKTNIGLIKEFITYNKKVLNSIEKVNLPFFNIKSLDGKVDTGAKRCSLHCSYIDVQKDRVIFTPLDKSYKQFKDKKYTLPLLDIVDVKSSNGISEYRPLVKIKIDIENKDNNIEAEFTLTDRSNMECPILLGNNILKGNFLIDVD